MMRQIRTGRYRGICWVYAPMCDVLITKLKTWRYWPKIDGQYTGDNFGTLAELYDHINSLGGPIDEVIQ